MKYSEMLAGFWDVAAREGLSSQEIALYHYLLHRAFTCERSRSVAIPSEEICKALGMSRPTLIRSRKRLCETGLIGFAETNGAVNTFTIEEGPLKDFYPTPKKSLGGMQKHCSPPKDSLRVKGKKEATPKNPLGVNPENEGTPKKSLGVTPKNSLGVGGEKLAKNATPPILKNISSNINNIHTSSILTTSTSSSKKNVGVEEEKKGAMKKNDELKAYYDSLRADLLSMPITLETIAKRYGFRTERVRELVEEFITDLICKGQRDIRNVRWIFNSWIGERKERRMNDEKKRETYAARRGTPADGKDEKDWTATFADSRAR